MSPFARHSLRVAVGLALAGLVCVAPISAETSPQEAARTVDRLLGEELFSQSTSERPTDAADDEVFLRRVMLDLVGQPPSVADTFAFSLDPAADKRARVVDRLLDDERFGRNWAGYWRDVILYRRSEDRALLAAQALDDYLTGQFNDNVPWDEVAASFITATGDVRTDGRTALIMAQAGRPEDTVAEISRIFMGIQIQCAQCHDHPTDRWNRRQFHELAAFFPRVAVRPNGTGGQRTFIVFAADSQSRFRRANANNRFRGTLEHRMSDLDEPSAPGEVMQPVLFATGQKLEPGANDAERRGALARWITSADNPWFAKALVNRLWAEMVGEGFYEPVDDLGPDRTSSAPETLDYLAAAFVESGHDVKWLMRTIVASEAYQRESRSRRNGDTTPFVANCNQRLRSDQLYESLTAALGIQPNGAGQRGRGGAYQRGRTPRALFSAAFGYDPSLPREDVAGSIPQALVMMNSPLINQSINARRGQLGRLLISEKNDEAVAVALYLKTLSRQPTDNELAVCLDYLKQVPDRNEAFEDILWSLINSTEFLHRR